MKFRRKNCIFCMFCMLYLLYYIFCMFCIFLILSIFIIFQLWKSLVSSKLCFSKFNLNSIKKNLPAWRAHSHHAQLASLASLSAPRARDLTVALRARSCALRIHLSLFLIIWYWSSNQFYNNITDDVNYTFSQSHSISFWI